ncbi:helix-turn-helix domain-containing protein [Mediterraneibacter gnavus]|uniref:helix-turn-helix domain-containing protein n=1 Tax=Mediterraneibacter gnavus TaxID=33038 RepID=UPI0035671D9C
MAELPGNIHERIGDLRIQKGYTKKKVSEDIGIPASQLTRIENEEIKSIGHELINKFADYYNVSTDFLLGRTDVKSPKNVELNELGLSNKALLTLLSGKIDVQLLSRMMEHKNFIPMMAYAESYFSGAHDAGFLSRNQVIDMAVTDISQYVKSNPEKTSEGYKDIRKLNAEKVTGTEADLEKLKSIFLSMLRDIKKEYAEPQEDISSDEFQNQMKEMKKQALQQKKKQHSFNENDMTNIVMGMLGGVDLDEYERQKFQELTLHLLKRTSSVRPKSIK